MVLPKDLLLGSLLKLNYEFVNCRGDYKFAENISQKSSLSLNMFKHPIHCIREIMFKRSDIEPNSSENVRRQTVIMNVITTPPAISEYHWYGCTWRLVNMSQSFLCTIPYVSTSPAWSYRHSQLKDKSHRSNSNDKSSGFTGAPVTSQELI